MKHPLARADLWVGLAAASALYLAAAAGVAPFSPLEAFAAAAGAACVYLVVRQSVWNFPLGIVSCAAYLVLFVRDRLFGDAALQVVFVALGFHGWYAWVRGGPGHTALRVGRVPPGEAVALAVLLPLAALGLQWVLIRVKGSAPLLDAQVTAMSLVAQWLLNRKYVENWYLWIALDVLSVYLYVTRELYLTAGLYAVFLGMCVAGVVTWTKALRAADVGPVGVENG